MEREIIGAVEAALAQKGVSVARFCRHADISQTTWQRLKKGDTTGFRAGTVGRLSIAFEQLTDAKWPEVRAKVA